MTFTGADTIFCGLVSGIVATAVMTVTEIPSWRKWGLLGVFEWHENQVLSTRFFHIPRDKLSFKYIFFLHFLNGSLTGIAFPLMLSILGVPITGYCILVPSVAYGFMLWIVTLVPIHKPITGYSVWNHQLGHLPSIASLIGHLIYGLVLGIVIMINY
ncbi:MAG: hypothetical protein QN649_11045 [Nitrososphaeraceae archaeon]|nr:hypothetical protein [Nitrososphaeraceae archaeon]